MDNAVDFTKSVLFEAYAERIGKRSAEDLFRRVNRWQELAGGGMSLWVAYDAVFTDTRWDRNRDRDDARRQVGNRKSLPWLGR